MWNRFRSTTNDQRQRQRPTTNDQRPTTNDQRPTTNDQRPTTKAGIVRSPSMAVSPFTLAPATPADVPLILTLIRELAEYERLGHEARATDPLLHDALFGPSPVAHSVIARSDDGTPAGFALYFFSFSTFVGRPGPYLEDLFVRPEFRKRGLGRLLLAHLARVAVDRGCGRMEWSV